MSELKNSNGIPIPPQELESVSGGSDSFASEATILPTPTVLVPVLMPDIPRVQEGTIGTQENTGSGAD